MFVYNVKINGSKVFKIFLACVIVVILCILAIICFRIFTGANQASKNSTCMPPSGVSKISAKNYTNILKTVHENIDDYERQKEQSNYGRAYYGGYAALCKFERLFCSQLLSSPVLIIIHITLYYSGGVL